MKPHYPNTCHKCGHIWHDNICIACETVLLTPYLEEFYKVFASKDIDYNSYAYFLCFLNKDISQEEYETILHYAIANKKTCEEDLLKNLANLQQKQQPETRGNSNSNTINGGYVAQSDQGVYYKNIKDGGSLYFNDIKLTNHPVSFINYYEEHVYYINNEDNYLYKQTQDQQSKPIKISDSELTNVHIYNGYIYAISITHGNSLCKLNISSNTEESWQYNTSISCKAINISLGFIYYIDQDYSIKKININLTNSPVPVTPKGYKCYKLNVVDNDVYYINATEGFKVYKNNVVWVTDICDTIHVHNNTIYYTSDIATKHMYKTSAITKGERQLVTNDHVQFINIVEDKLYYVHNYELKCGGQV